MEHGGESLHTIAGKLNKQNFYMILSQLIQVLELLESIGVAHFDLKPKNLVWDSKKCLLKVIDFGTSMAFYHRPETIASQIGKFSTRITGYTELYAPPELTNEQTKENRKEIIPSKVDVFCFGMTCIHLLFLMHNQEINIELKKSEELINKFLEFIQIIFENKFGEGKLFQILKPCLQYKAENRPTFHEIKKFFMNLYQKDVSLSEKDKNLIDSEKMDYHYHKMFAKTYLDINQFDVAAIHYEIYFKMLLENKKLEKIINKKDLIQDFSYYVKAKISDLPEIQFKEFFDNIIKLYISLTNEKLPDLYNLCYEIQAKCNDQYSNYALMAEVKKIL